jgi:hypothetical protein
MVEVLLGEGGLALLELSTFTFLDNLGEVHRLDLLVRDREAFWC